MSRSQIIAVFMAIGGVVAIIILSNRFLHPPGSTPLQQLQGSGALASSAPSESSTASSSEVAPQSSDSSITAASSSSAESLTPLTSTLPSLVQVRMPAGAAYREGPTHLFVSSAPGSSSPQAMVRIDGTLTLGKQQIATQLFLEPAATVTADQLEKALPGLKREGGDSTFGMGGELGVFQDTAADVAAFSTKQGLPGRMFVRTWGSAAASDLTAYLLPQLPSELFDRALADFQDVWPDTSVPATLTTSFVRQLSDASDLQAVPYQTVDQFVRSMQF